MWYIIKYFILAVFMVLSCLWVNFNFFKFGVVSELLWLFAYTLLSVMGSQINDVMLLTLPFLILTLTAIEAVVFWSLLLLNIR